MTPNQNPKDAPSQSARPQPVAGGSDQKQKPAENPVRYTDWASI